MKQNFRAFKQLSIRFIIIILLYSSCQTDELTSESQISIENEMVSKSKEFLQTNNPDLTILQYTKNILWENAIISYGAKGKILEVPLVLLDHIGTLNNNPQELKDFHRLLFLRDNKNNLKVYHLQVITNPKSFDNLSAEFNFYSRSTTFDGLIALTDSNKNTVDYVRFEDGEKIKPSKTSKVAALTCLYFGWWYSDGSFRPISILSCSSGGGASESTGYGYHGSGGATPSNDSTVAPSCESFNFKSRIGTLWQESAVVNIHFNIVIIDPKGYKFGQIVNYPNAILFGAPTNLAVGNTTISAGLAATLSAQAVEISMKETVAVYGNKPVSELTVRLYFEQRLKYNYPLFIPGGRVNFNASTFIGTPSYYKTNMFGTGDCN
jgi:hypothetical protein